MMIWDYIRARDELPAEFPISERRAGQLARIKSEKRRAQALWAEYLLMDMLRRYAPHVSLPPVIGESRRGKPYLADYAGPELSLSHSGEYVACALSDRPVGIDIQIMRPYREGIAHRYFAPSELARLEEAQDKTIAFYELWTAKESLIKAAGLSLGEGLECPIDLKYQAGTSVAFVSKAGKGYRIRARQFMPGYMCAIAQEESLEKGAFE